MKRSAAACCTARPPATEPVKATKSMRGSLITRVVSAWLRWRNWNSPLGRPPARSEAKNRSAQSGVCAECLSRTALPAISAGITALTAVR